MRVQPRFARSVAGILVLQGVVLVLSITTAAIIARSLGPVGKGLLTMALLIPATIEMMLNFGVGIANVYYGGSGRLESTELASNTLLFAALGTTAGFVLLALAVLTGATGALFPELPSAAILVASLALPFMFLNRSLEGLLQGLHRVRSVHAVRALEAAVLLGLTATLVIGLGMGAVSAVAAYVIAAGLTTLSLVVLLRRARVRFAMRWDPTVARSVAEYGLRGHAGNVLQYMNYRLDMFIMVYFLGPAAVGIYSVAVRLAELLWYLPDAVGFALFPKAAATNAREMNRFTPRAFRITFMMTLLMGVGLAIIGRPLIELIYSDAFVDAFVPMLALLPGAVLLGAAKVLTNDIAGRGYPQYNSMNAAGALVATIALDLLLIPALGLVGAAIASSLVYALIFVVALLFHRRVRGHGIDPAHAILVGPLGGLPQGSDPLTVEG